MQNTLWVNEQCGHLGMTEMLSPRLISRDGPGKCNSCEHLENAHMTAERIRIKWLKQK